MPRTPLTAREQYKESEIEYIDHSTTISKR